MKNPFLNNKSLAKFINAVGIRKEHKTFLLSILPNLDLESRLKLFNALKEIFLLDLEENEVLNNLRKFIKSI